MTRLEHGGSGIDRGAPVRFTFDGRELTGLRGDTLASALLADGVRGAWRSIYHGRPRGIMGLGAEDPCALVQVTRDGISEPMLRATEVELTEGLVAESLAGRGRLVPDAVAPHHDKRHVHCDVLVIGGGAAGCAAASAAAAGGARVILAERTPVLAAEAAAQPAAPPPITSTSQCAWRLSWWGATASGTSRPRPASDSAARPSVSSTSVARSIGSEIPSRVTCTSAHGSSGPRPMIPRGRSW